MHVGVDSEGVTQKGLFLPLFVIHLTGLASWEGGEGGGGDFLRAQRTLSRFTTAL